MASSSSSLPSHSTAASSSQFWNHYVFLSFRGEDTRKTFVDHLYSALDQQGIYTYKDDVKLPRGESIGSSLLKAIRESRIAVIVFSKNYADSSWCLDELAYIMECMYERGQIVFPVFYDVDPSDVRKQTGEFGKAFAKQEWKNNDKVESWRKALQGAANLSGWEPKYVANGHESKCIKEIVDTISLRLHPLTSSANVNLFGIETRVQDLKSRLQIELGGVYMVGIWGVGGGGKSTLAFSICKEISNGFDGFCFVENVREESRKFGLAKLQERILLGVLKLKEVIVGSVEEGRCMIQSRLRHKNVLIVLDDVDHLDHLQALAGSLDWFGEGSRIIITTRDKHLLNAHKVNVIYNISLLNVDEAIQLFRWHAPREYRPIEDYETLSLDVVSYAGGLPLALKVLGLFLCDKDIRGWRSTLARLKDIPDSDIVGKLKISYDGLEPMEKELFLDIACFYRGWHSEDEAMMILDACGFHPIIGVKVLIQKALVTITNGRFDMHDLVEEMGHYVVRGKNYKIPEMHSRVWREEDVQKICDGDAMMENDKIEVLRSYSKHPRLPHVVANMKNLRWFYWNNNSTSSLPTRFQPSKLCGLILEYGLQKQLWKGYKYLPSLKMLDLRYSMHLIATPNFDGVPNLERLTISRCWALKEIHPSIGYHKRLVFLHVGFCSMLEMFPPIVRMQNLETLILVGCSKLRNFPEIKTNMDSLEHLDLHESGIDGIPSSIGQYCTNLVSFDVSYCSHVKRIESNFRALKCLRRLKLNDCTQLETLPEDLFDAECCLEELSLPPKWQLPSSQHSTMELFKNIMSSLGVQFSHKDLVMLSFPHLPHFLRKLDLSRCSLLDGDIPYDICELSNLKVLNLKENKFYRLDSSLSKLPRLKFLDVSDCKSLVELPELPSSIAVLIADNCCSLETVADFPTRCKWLWKVSLMRRLHGHVSGISGGRLLQSMLEGNAIDNHFLSLKLGDDEIIDGFIPSIVRGKTFSLQLPQKWSHELSGFLIYASMMAERTHPTCIEITMKEEMGMDSQSKICKASDDAFKSCHHYYDPITYMSYLSFGSLRHTAWWNSEYKTISFSIDYMRDSVQNTFGVGLVRKICISGPREAGIDFSEFWDEQGRNHTFEIIDDSKSVLKILWNPW